MNGKIGEHGGVRSCAYPFACFFTLADQILRDYYKLVYTWIDCKFVDLGYRASLSS